MGTWIVADPLNKGSDVFRSGDGLGHGGEELQDLVRLLHLQDEPRVPFVLQLDDDGAREIVDIVEEMFARRIIGARDDDAGEMRAGRANAVPDRFRFMLRRRAATTCSSGKSRWILKDQSLSQPSTSTFNRSLSMVMRVMD
jgi:hypothetical protein